LPRAGFKVMDYYCPLIVVTPDFIGVLTIPRPARSPFVPYRMWTKPGKQSKTFGSKTQRASDVVSRWFISFEGPGTS
jgi:hypothetical protein